MNAPASAIKPPNAQAPRIRKSEWTCCATTYGLMKMPEPMIPPMTIIVASKRPRRRASRWSRSLGFLGWLITIIARWAQVNQLFRVISWIDLWPNERQIHEIIYETAPPLRPALLFQELIRDDQLLNF